MYIHCIYLHFEKFNYFTSNFIEERIRENERERERKTNNGKENDPYYFE